MDQVLFYGLASIAVIGALATIFSRNAMYCVLSLVVTFFALAGLYLLLNAEFVAIVHIIVYAGAIMVLFLFVVMMLNLNTANTSIRRNKGIQLLAALFGLAVLGIMAYGAWTTTLPSGSDSNKQTGTVKVLGQMLFDQYLLPFELTSVLLIATMVGVIVLTKKEE